MLKLPELPDDLQILINLMAEKAPDAVQRASLATYQTSYLLKKTEDSEPKERMILLLLLKQLSVSFQADEKAEIEKRIEDAFDILSKDLDSQQKPESPSDRPGDEAGASGDNGEATTTGDGNATAAEPSFSVLERSYATLAAMVGSAGMTKLQVLRSKQLTSKTLGMVKGKLTGVKSKTRFPTTSDTVSVISPK